MEGGPLRRGRKGPPPGPQLRGTKELNDIKAELTGGGQQAQRTAFGMTFDAQKLSDGRVRLTVRVERSRGAAPRGLASRFFSGEFEEERLSPSEGVFVGRI